MNKKITILIIAVLAVFAVCAVIYRAQNKKIETVQNKTEQEKEADAVEAANKDILNNSGEAQAVKPIDKTDHYQGDLNAPVQIILYNDFDCPYYKEVNDTINKVEQEFGDKVVIAFRHYPISIHSNAMPAALAAECAAEQGKFWEMHDQLLKDKEANEVNAAQYKADAKSLGLDREKFNKCLDEEKYKDAVYAQMDEGKSAGVQGTPSYFVNGGFIPGAVPFEDYTASDGSRGKGMKSVIEEMMKQ